MPRKSQHFRRFAASAFLLLGAASFAPSCFDAGVRWEDIPPPAGPGVACTLNDVRCTVVALERCDEGPSGPAWVSLDDCAAKDEVCVASLLACKPCQPGQRTCDGADVLACRNDASAADLIETCDAESGNACRSGSCVQLCALAAKEKGNIGCEYWAVDLDNAMINATSNAAGQQFAVVVSNPQPDVAADITIYQDDGAPGDAPAPVIAATGKVPPLGLLVFKLGPREVDGSPEGEFDTGTHTALTRHATASRPTFPVAAYQFNPLENANVFSNDASLLKSREALTYEGNSIAGRLRRLGLAADHRHRPTIPTPTSTRLFPSRCARSSPSSARAPTRNVRVRPKHGRRRRRSRRRDTRGQA
jgi:hypothetical protein